MKRNLLIAALMISLAAVVGPSTMRAQDEQQQEQEQPTSGVARISLINGDVSMQRGDSGDWVATTVNAPLVRGDKVSTGDRSRAEVQLDYANILRLDQHAEASIADLTRNRIQLQVAQGTVNYTVLKGTQADVEIDTPNMAVHPLGEGSYRIQVNSPSDTQVIVRDGQAEVSTPQGSTRADQGQMIYVRGTDNPEYQVARAERPDGWDEWNRDRDRAIQSAQSWGHTNRYYTGSEDLDRYGHWRNVPDYGSVWSPDVEDSGWAPYREGRWVWEPYWGWTWVSYEPWGWAPYHYGRWLWYDDSWCWWPGYVTPAYYPVWAPAYVSFFGFGFGGRHWGFGFGFGFGSVGWLPLGPVDPCFPWWGFHNSYNVVNVTNINNITNVTNVNNIYNHTFVRNGGGAFGSNLQTVMTNNHVRGALTTVSAQNFANGRVPRNPRMIDTNTLRQGSLVNGKLPVAPNRQSLQPINRPVNRGSIPRNAGNEQRFFSKNPAAPVRPSFNQQAAGVQRMMQTQTSLAAANMNRANINGPAGMAAGRGNATATNRGNLNGPAGMAANRGNAGAAVNRPNAVGPAGTSPFGGNANRPAVNGQQPSARANGPANTNPGWQRFGQGRTSGAAPGSVNAPSQMGQRPEGGNLRSTPSQAAPRTNAPTVNREQPASPGWQRFGRPAPTSGAGNVARPSTGNTQQRWPSSVNMPSSHGNESAPRQAAPSRSEPAPQSGSQGGWQRFSSQPRTAPAARAPAPSAPRSEPASPGWSRFSSQPRSSGGSSWRGSSGGYQRQPLDLRKPITTERTAPRAYQGGGGGNYRGWSAPSGGGRSYSEPYGGGRSYSAPSGGGRSYSAPSGGGRGWSAPSGGGRSYSAPSGGGRSYSGGGGGGRSYSAPSGGGHSSGGSRGSSSSSGGHSKR